MWLQPHVLLIGMLVSWLGFLTILAILPGFPNVPVIPNDYLGPIGHYTTHFVLTGMIYFLLRTGFNGFVKPDRALLVAYTASLVVGVTLEVLQLFVETRSVTLVDIMFNAVGSLSFGVLAASIRNVKFAFCSGM